MKIGEWLREYRRTHGLTMQEVADRCKFSKTYVYMLEKGVNNKTGKALSPTIQSMTKIADMADMTVDELIQILDDDQPVVVNRKSSHKDENKPLTAKKFLQILCRNDAAALAAVERLELTQEGELRLTGADLASQAILDHEVRGLIEALRNARLTDDGRLHFEYSPGGKERK